MSPLQRKIEESESADFFGGKRLKDSNIANNVSTQPEVDRLEDKAFISQDIDSSIASKNTSCANEENQLYHRCFDAESSDSKNANNHENTSFPCFNINTRKEFCHQNQISSDFPEKKPKKEEGSPPGEAPMVSPQDGVEVGLSKPAMEPSSAACHYGILNNGTEINSPPTDSTDVTPADRTEEGEEENQSSDEKEGDVLLIDTKISPPSFIFLPEIKDVPHHVAFDSMPPKYPHQVAVPTTDSLGILPALNHEGSAVIYQEEEENQSTNKLSKDEEITASTFLNPSNTKQFTDPESTGQLDSMPRRDPHQVVLPRTDSLDIFPALNHEGSAVIYQGGDEKQSTDDPEPTVQLNSMPQNDPHQVALPTTHSLNSLPALDKPEIDQKNAFDQLLKPASHDSQLQAVPTSTEVVCTDIDWVRAGSIYYGVVMGVMEDSIQNARRQLQENFKQNFMLPYYRTRHYNSVVPSKVEVYIFVRGKKGVKFKKIFTMTVSSHDIQQPLETRVIEGALVHEETFNEYPQFVEVTQPPTRRNFSVVEADGAISDLANDPPGQQSVYIPPGDIRIETYRLSTFENFPKTTPVNVPELARYGFYFTGYSDRVKCYCCGRIVEKWEIGDKPSDKRWHKQDCTLARGLGHDNVPIGGFFSTRFANGNLYDNAAPQPMDVGLSQAQRFNEQVTRRPNDVTDLTGSGGTFQIQPGSTYVIGSPAARQASPVTSTPNMYPSAGSNPPRGWRMANVISADHKRHLTNLFLNREIDRLASFSRWPTGRPNVAPVALARAGFFYLGDMDRTQCFSCGGVLRNWNYEDDAMDEHRTHFANCRLVVGVERRNVPVPSRPEMPRELAERYPLRFPMNPHMRSEASRLQTFDRRWPMNKTRVQPQDIAEAGFFFLGERDRVKCWYCNGGLQNWEYDDIPWVEHSKWFPNCQFLLAKQGQLFVYRHLSLSPHLPRPIIGRQDGATVDPSTATPHSSQSARSQDVPPSVSRARAPSPPPAIIDPQEELRKRGERVQKEMQSDTVKVLTTMGYEESVVRRTLMDQLESGNPHDADNIFDGVASLLDAVLRKEEEIRQEEDDARATTSIKFPSVSSNYSALTVGSMDTNGPSSGQASGVYNVSGFDSDDEERDLYSSIKERPSVGGISVCAAGGATNGPISVERETRTRPHIWDDVPDDPESIKEFIEQKKEERLCKICFTETADMVFIPCSHMCCCKTCTEAIRNCPICREKIVKAIKTYVK